MAAVVFGSELRVYADGQSLIIPQWGSGCLKLQQPYLQAVEVNRDRDCFELGGYRRYMPREMQVTATLISNAAEWFDGPVPDLASIAEQLTISELFKVIDRKLDKRE